jgi:hypothetical protein
MKKRINTSRWMFGLVAAGCTLGVTLPPRVSAEVSDADFNALRDLVQQMNGKLQALTQTNQLDQQTIQQLKQQLAETQQTAVDAQQKSIAATQTQPVPRTPIDEATVNHNFQILGDAEFQYVKTDGQHGAFVLADFAPIFLYRGGDNILFEAGFDTFIQNSSGGGYSTTFNLSFAQLDYVVNDYITLCTGDLLLPLGTYSQRGAGWLNKIPDDPLVVDALIPGTGVGAELEGAIPVGDAGKFINYSIYGVNGPSSTDGTGKATSLDLGGNVGTDGSTVANLHNDPAGGARIGLFLPFKPHYDLEVGISGLAGQWDNVGNHLWVGGVVDAAMHLGPNFEAKGEYIATKYGSDDFGNISQNGWFAQVGYKLAGLDLELPLINNVELIGRYDSLRNSYDSNDNAFDFNTKRYTVGSIYYFNSTLLFETDYEFLDSNDPSQANQLILQLSYGF